MLGTNSTARAAKPRPAPSKRCSKAKTAAAGRTKRTGKRGLSGAKKEGLIIVVGAIIFTIVFPVHLFCFLFL